jgi:aryl sulfotransferase
VQRIVSLLIFQKLDVIQIDKVFPWWERRTGASIEDIARAFESQSHQRSIKTHLPLDGLPVFDEVKYIHVVRDGRDVALSYHNHCVSHTPESIDHLDKIGMADETLLKPYPGIPQDPSAFFHKWLTTPAVAHQSDGSPFLSYFDFEKTYFDVWGQKNFLFLHYNDLYRNLVGEMERMADFLEIRITNESLRALSEGVSLTRMRQEGASLIPLTTSNFSNGASGFFNMGGGGRWKGKFSETDLLLFAEKMKGHIPIEQVNWMLSGANSTTKGYPR